MTPSAHTATVTIGGLADEPDVSAARGQAPDTGRAGVAVRMLTSGTTGPPKRIDLTYDMLARSVIGMDFDVAPSPTEPRRGVAIVNAPLVHIGGVFRVLQCVCRSKVIRTTRPIRAGPLGRRRAQAPTTGGVVGARGASHGAAFRSDARRSREHSRRHLGNGTAFGRGCRRLHRQVRHPGPDVLRRNGVRRRCRGVDAARLSEVLADQARQRGQSHSRRTPARRRRRRRSRCR